MSIRAVAAPAAFSSNLPLPLAARPVAVGQVLLAAALGPSPPRSLLGAAAAALGARAVTPRLTARRARGGLAAQRRRGLHRLRIAARRGPVVVAGGGGLTCLRASPEEQGGESRDDQSIGGRVGDAIGGQGSSWWRLSISRREKPWVATLEREEKEEDDGFNPEGELALLKKKGPARVAMLGTRECSFQHQQEIELMSEARVSRGDHVFTSGSSGTNSAVIRGAMRAKRPQLLTVILPQSLSKQDSDAQTLLRSCMKEGVEVVPMDQNDELPLAEAAALCNTKVLERVERLVAFAQHESQVYCSLVDEAKKKGIMTTAFYLN